MRDPVTGDRVSLVAGLATCVLGALVLLDASGTLELTIAYALPAVLAAAGVVLLVLGLSRR